MLSVSVTTVLVAQSLLAVTMDSASTTDQLTCTVPRHQEPLPGNVQFTDGVITGGVRSGAVDLKTPFGVAAYSVVSARGSMIRKLAEFCGSPEFIYSQVNPPFRDLDMSCCSANANRVDGVCGSIARNVTGSVFWPVLNVFQLIPPSVLLFI